MTTVREALFQGIDMGGCTNGDCIIRKNHGMVTNGSCGCLHNLNRSQLYMLKSKLSSIIDKEVVGDIPHDILP